MPIHGEVAVLYNSIAPQFGRLGQLWMDTSVGPPVLMEVISLNPIVYAAVGGGGGGSVNSVNSGTGVTVDNTDAANPIVNLSAASVAALADALTAVQPGDLAAVAFSGAYGDLSGTPTIPPDLSAADFLTSSDESVLLPNSRRLLPGTNVAFDDTVPNARTVNVATPATPSPLRTVGMTFDGGGSPPTVGSVGYFVCQFAGVINQWSIVGDIAGSAVVDVWKVAGAIPTNADSIAGTEKPTLAAQQLASHSALTTWSIAVAAGDVFGFEIESVATCTRLTVEVRIAETL